MTDPNPNSIDIVQYGTNVGNYWANGGPWGGRAPWVHKNPPNPTSSVPSEQNVPDPVPTANPVGYNGDRRAEGYTTNEYPYNEPVPNIIPFAGTGGTPNQGNVLPIALVAAAVYLVYQLHNE